MLYKLLMRVLLVCLIYHNAMQIGASVHKRRKQESALRRPRLIILKQRAKSAYDKFVDLLGFPQVFFVLCLDGNVLASIYDAHRIRFCRIVFFTDKLIKQIEQRIIF